MDITKDSVFLHTFSCESDLLDIKKYFKEFSHNLTPFEICEEEKCKSGSNASCDSETCKNDEFYLKELGINKNELKELKERTSVDHLTCEGEMEIITPEFYKKFHDVKLKQKPLPDETEEDNNLMSVKSRSEMDDSKNEMSRTFFKYCNYQWSWINEKLTKLNFNVEDYSSVVFCVKVYHPFLSHKERNPKIKLLQEIHILGNQTVADLKDKILCFVDYVGAEDKSDEFFLDKLGPKNLSKDKYPSSFIFIENTFYNDTRSPKMIDLSSELRDWATSRDLGTFDCKSMENTKMCDINLKIGRPYVFQHQGNCEHVIFFSDIRFLELSDPSQPYCFPRTHCSGRNYGKRCMMCGDLYARWLVVRNERLTHDKTYLCKKCFVSYNYIDKKKIGKFEAYEYTDSVALL